MWLWHRPAAVALIQPLAWEPLYATDIPLKRPKKKKKFKRVDLRLSVLSTMSLNYIFLSLKEKKLHKSLPLCPAEGQMVALFLPKWLKLRGKMFSLSP